MLNFVDSDSRSQLTPELRQILWIGVKIAEASRLDPAIVARTSVEFYGSPPEKENGQMGKGPAGLVEYVRKTAKKNQAASVCIIVPIADGDSGTRGFLCHVEVLFGKGKHSLYSYCDGRILTEVDRDIEMLGRLLYAPGEPRPN